MSVPGSSASQTDRDCRLSLVVANGVGRYGPCSCAGAVGVAAGAERTGRRMSNWGTSEVSLSHNKLCPR